MVLTLSLTVKVVAVVLLALSLGAAFAPSLPGHGGLARLSLDVQPVEGQPGAVQLVAHLKGGLDFSPGLHCQTERWDFGDDHTLAVMPFCPPWTPTAKAQRHFERIHTYDAPGEYMVRFSYGKLDSPAVEVTVP